MSRLRAGESVGPFPSGPCLATAWSPQVPAQRQGRASSCLLLTRWLIHVDFFESRYREKSFQNRDTDVLLQEPGVLGVCLGLDIPRGAFPGTAAGIRWRYW